MVRVAAQPDPLEQRVHGVVATVALRVHALDAVLVEQRRQQ